MSDKLQSEFVMQRVGEYLAEIMKFVVAAIDYNRAVMPQVYDQALEEINQDIYEVYAISKRGINHD